MCPVTTEDTGKDIFFIMEYMEKMSDANSLIDAFNQSKKGCIWKESVQRYEINLLRNTYQIQKEIREETYEQKPFFKFKLNERGHTRMVKSLHISDRVVQRSVCDNILLPTLNKYLTYDNGASVKGKGIDFTRDRFEAHLHRYYKETGSNEGYILQIDFRKFFDNIQHEPLIDAISKKIPDEATMKFIAKLIDGFKIDVSDMTDEEYSGCMDRVYNALEMKESTKGEKFMKKSLGIGSQISQISGVFFPTVIDNFCKIIKGMKYFARYMDDIYIIHRSKEFLQELLEELKTISKSIGLFINEKKTQVVKLSHGFTFLKTKYILTSTGRIIKKMCSASITRERRKLKKFKNLVENGKITFLEVLNQFKSWKGTTKRFNCYHSIHCLDGLFNFLFSDYLVKGGAVA